jgi:membrane-bound lytic murein transglycosylase A
MHEVLTPIRFSEIAGWPSADLPTSLSAFQRSAREILGTATGFRRAAAWGGELADWRDACKAAETATDAIRFFTDHFRPFRVTDADRPAGLFTGYYEPWLNGSLQQSAAYPVPVYARPDDLVTFTAEETAHTGLSYGKRVAGQALAYDTREQIEQGSLVGKASVICWLSDWADAFFMHVQGQGRVVLEDRSQIRLSYAAKSGHAYSGIGHVLIERGVAPPEKMSMQVLRDWMKAHPHDARALMWHNKSYIFFQKAQVNDAALGGIGAAKVNLTPLVSLAVDRAHWMFGTPLWVETSFPPEAPEGGQPIRRMMIAQDTGSAIRGIVRGDFFWGWGVRAETIAGHMKSPGTMTALLPLPLAHRLGHRL